MLRFAFLVIVATTIKSYGDKAGELRQVEWIRSQILDAFNMTGRRPTSLNYTNSIAKLPGKPVQTMDPVLLTTNTLMSV